MAWQPFTILGLGSGFRCENENAWRSLAKELITDWGFDLNDILDSRQFPISSSREMYFELKEGTMTVRSSALSLRAWAKTHRMTLNSSDVQKLQPNPRIPAWRKFLQGKVAAVLKTRNPSASWFYADEIKRETGFMLDHFPSIVGALRPFEGHKKVRVTQHTFDRGGSNPKDNYFVVEG